MCTLVPSPFLNFGTGNVPWTRSPFSVSNYLGVLELGTNLMPFYMGSTKNKYWAIRLTDPSKSTDNGNLFKILAVTYQRPRVTKICGPFLAQVQT